MSAIQPQLIFFQKMSFCRELGRGKIHHRQRYHFDWARFVNRYCPYFHWFWATHYPWSNWLFCLHIYSHFTMIAYCCPSLFSNYSKVALALKLAISELNLTVLECDSHNQATSESFSFSSRLKQLLVKYVVPLHHQQMCHCYLWIFSNRRHWHTFFVYSSWLVLEVKWLSVHLWIPSAYSHSICLRMHRVTS